MATRASNVFANAAPVRRPANLSSMALEIARHVPRMRAACGSETEFWDWFAGEVDSLRRNAGSREEAENLIDMLKRAAGESPLPPPA